MTTLQLQHYGIYPAVGKENFAAYMRAEVAKWSKVIKEANIRID